MSDNENEKQTLQDRLKLERQKCKVLKQALKEERLARDSFDSEIQQLKTKIDLLQKQLSERVSLSQRVIDNRTAEISNSSRIRCLWKKLY